MHILLGTFFTSFFIALIGIPSIIKIAQIKGILDEPGPRKEHSLKTPTLGGIAIFAGTILSQIFWVSISEIPELKYILCSVIVTFFIGLKDDLFDLVPYKKFLAQLVASFILVHWAGIKITGLHGIAGIQELDSVYSYLFSIFTILVIMNSFNLIDGIDTLAGVVALIVSSFFGIWFLCANNFSYGILAFSLAGSLLAYLYFNKTPAKIFMGDTGSLFIGLSVSVLTIKFLETDKVQLGIFNYPVMAISLLIVPLFDTLRVFIKRLSKGHNPFIADKTHIHHLLVAGGRTHIQTTILLVFLNLCFFIFGFFMQEVRTEITLSLILVFCIMLSYKIEKLK